jgi:thiamine-monophosphate kinase
VSRAGARPGDAIFVSGALGDSALALRRLQAGEIPVELGRALAAERLATAMIDLSDGLIADLGHVLHASGVAAQVERTALPLSESFRQALADDPELEELALAGGEDYELLFTVSADREAEISRLAAELGVPLTRIGRVTSGEGLTLIDEGGGTSRPGSGGFDHFR